MNPYGEDDDDFDMNWLVDRHLQVCYMMIDDVGQFPPTPVKDRHWEKGVLNELPHTVASLPFRGVVPPTSSHDVEVTLEEFYEYFGNLSGGIPSDDFFVLMMEQCWDQLEDEQKR